jgi:hypothetical protein
MTLDEILQDIHALEQDLLAYERKYGVLSETFYESYVSGEEPADDTWVLDWSDWAAAYEIWLRRHQQYQEIIQFPIAPLYPTLPSAPAAGGSFPGAW